MSDTSTNKEDKPVEKEWTFGDGSRADMNTGWSMLGWWFFTFCIWLVCFIWFGMISYVSRGLIGCVALFFIWACVCIRYAPKYELRCSPDCSYCERKRSP